MSTGMLLANDVICTSRRECAPCQRLSVAGLHGRTDSKWHHIAVTWEQRTGATKLHFDGAEQAPAPSWDDLCLPAPALVH